MYGFEKLVVTYNRYGNTIIGTDGSMYSAIGNIIWGSDGTSYVTAGNITYSKIINSA